MTDDEKSYWRIYAALQEIMRVSDEDIERDPELKQLIHAVSNVAIIYRMHGASSVLIDRKMKRLEELGIPVIKPKNRPK